MKNKFVLTLLLVMGIYTCIAQKPIITNAYTADPSAHVFNDTLFVYPSHDRDRAQWWDMNDWHVYSTTDMENWTDHGVCLSLDDLSWATKNAWAPDCNYYKGKYYYYYPTDSKNIGVAVSDKATGPFTDPLGKPLISKDTPGVKHNRDLIDPTIFIDDDGSPYLFFGQNIVNAVKLNDDMISYSESIQQVEGCDHFFEAIWVHKYNDKYYLSYSGKGKILYATAHKVMGPYTYQGEILHKVNSETNHHSIVEFNGKWYLFYHTADLALSRLPKDHPEHKYHQWRRSVCFQELKYKKDGSIVPVKHDLDYNTLQDIDVDKVKKQVQKQVNHALELAKPHWDDKAFLPRYFEHGHLKYVSASDWTSGFFPGVLWYTYELLGGSKLKKVAVKYTERLEEQKFNTSTHDTGFMMYCSYGNALRLTGNKDYEPILVQTSESLLKRYNETIGCIRSWDHNPDHWDFPVIIDNMMNLEMLCWAAKTSGDQKFLDVAKTHANTTIENHFRDDFSTYHVVDYNPKDGSVNEKVTNQGYADETAWARGQTWGLYGYTLMYRETKDKKYLEQAEKIAGFLLNHPNLPADLVPYWDFNAPNVPNAVRDASSAAIIASALFELCEYSPEKKDWYLQNAIQIMKSLCSDDYLAAPGTNNGFILKHSTGNMPINKEIDTPIIYADYYFLEALLRMDKKLGSQ